MAAHSGHEANFPHMDANAATKLLPSPGIDAAQWERINYRPQLNGKVRPSALSPTGSRESANWYLQV